MQRCQATIYRQCQATVYIRSLDTLRDVLYRCVQGLRFPSYIAISASGYFFSLTVKFELLNCSSSHSTPAVLLEIFQLTAFNPLDKFILRALLFLLSTEGIWQEDHYRNSNMRIRMCRQS